MNPMRIIIYACVTDIDGCAQRRHVRLGEDFCSFTLHRPLNSTLDPACYDHIHIPADFDSEQPLKRWFILDLNVTQPLNKEEMSLLPHQVYLASLQNGKLYAPSLFRYT
jgi:methylsterol monooxygenase